jgi:hypothetical protein
MIYGTLQYCTVNGWSDEDETETGSGPVFGLPKPEVVDTINVWQEVPDV